MYIYRSFGYISCQIQMEMSKHVVFFPAKVPSPRRPHGAWCWSRISFELTGGLTPVLPSRKEAGKALIHLQKLQGNSI